MQIKQISEASEDLLLIRPFEQGFEPENQNMFKAEKGEMWWYSSRELWIGLGKSPQLPAIIKIFRSLFFKRKDRWPEKIVLDCKVRTPEWIENAVNGIIIGGYDLQLYKTEPKPLSAFFNTGTLSVLTENHSPEIDKALIVAQKTALVQMRIMDLMNAPSNYKTPATLAQWATESGEKNGYKVTVLDKSRLEELGMHALLAVGKGSEAPPLMIVSEYEPEHYTKTIALVGKGVTFDTGGISIKTSANMHLMKSDMGGAAAVLGAVELAAQLKMPVRIIGVIPSTENSVDGLSMKPGDVIGSYSGKTIEVIDTDAEGRLILADGLSYAVRTFKPDVVIDLATLTGSVIQTLGYEAAGLFTPNNELAEALTQAGDNTGERMWRLPVWDSYKEEIASDIADVKNYHGKPLAGAIVAAKFLEAFTDEHPAWAHLDIAGTAFGDTEFAPGRAGTAYGVRLLRAYLAAII
ncbi:MULTISPECIES: M17 family metallopeptidase [Dyadobacter]|uniref:Probable cytosol aminopeptidase n=1 Tax=Dyadobacter chenhuakuii TaxID=2909339 RepID=A0ABY4XJZ0_9BACT|nr:MULTISPECIES: leucyl aminopeptidase family protein [Dyadobacter]MCF2493619.1 leucyl aminopeptidase family protein [Dyadobacter chenhuakuii]MCF2517866.1 leucyl aminopeptidase family protein [Dyadobacter sp. CY351]USJ30756.1 leucyl aminopeptidase family protein [Dyadobacter chenhuakuii]